MATRIKVGIVGAGQITSNRHVPTLAGLADDVEIVGVADPNPAAGDQLARTAGTTSYGSPEEMLSKARPDAVVVGVPNRFHAAVAIEALEAGKHVLCEKPPAMTVEEAQAMAAAAASSGKVLLYGMVYRHMVPGARALVGELGEIYLARAEWLRRRGIPGWGAYTSKEAQGGGAFIDLGVHVVDLAWFLMGRPAVHRVGGTTYGYIGRSSKVGLLGPVDRETFGVEDTAVGAMMCGGEARCDWHIAFAANQPEREKVGITLHGHHGTMVVPLLTGQPRPKKKHLPRVYDERAAYLLDTVIAMPVPPTMAEGFTLQAKHFIACCRGEEEPIAGPSDGVTIQKIINGFYASAASTDRVVIHEDD